MTISQPDVAVALYDRFLRGLAHGAGRVAVRDGADCVTYGEVHERALALAGALLDAVPDTSLTVGVLADRGIGGWTGILAGLYAGAAVVPLNPTFPRDRLWQMIAAAGVSALVTDGHGGSVLPALATRLPVLTALSADGIHSGGHRNARVAPDTCRKALDLPRAVRSTDPAYVLFTSGSSGASKAVAVTHGNLSHYFQSVDARYDFAPDDVFSQTFDLGFGCSMFDLFAGWGAGARVVRVPANAYRDLPSFVAAHDLTVWFSTPSRIPLVRRMDGLGPNALRRLRWSLFAGEALPLRDAADWQQAAPMSTVESLYGPTEFQVTPGYLTSDNGGPFEVRDSRARYRTGDRVRRVDGGELVYLGPSAAQVQPRDWRGPSGIGDQSKSWWVEPAESTMHWPPAPTEKWTDRRCGP